MNNFSYYNPTQLLFGKGQIGKLSKVVPTDARVLLLYGSGSIKRNGVYDQLIEAMSHLTVIEYSGIKPNPDYDQLMEAVALAKDKDLNFIVAVGGGSVIDGAKFVAAATCYDGEDPWDILANRARISSAIPIGAVLTLPATGSESNPTSVVTRGKDKLAFQNQLVFPKFAILDPTTSFSLPLRQVANGVVDAFVHVVEQYMTYPVNAPIQDQFAESILKTLISEGPKTLADLEDYDSRANVMLSANMALNGLIGLGVPQDWATHMIGHELTALYGLDHAQTLAVVLPSVLRAKANQKQEKLSQYASRIWGLDISDPQHIEKAIDKTEEFFNSLGVKTTLSGYDLGEEAIQAVLDSLEKHNHVTLGEHRDIDLAVTKQILQMAM